MSGPTLVSPGGSTGPVRIDPAELASRQERRAQLGAAGLVALALMVLGAALGVVWDLVSPDTPPGIISPPGIQVDDVHESFAGTDGRFALITTLVGLLAGVGAWYLRRVRGAYVAIGLAVGGLLGAMLTHLIGHVLRGAGSYQYTNGGTAYLTHLPLNVQMKGLWFVEPALATLVYSLLVAFAAAYDLGRPEVRRPRRAVAPVAPAPAQRAPPDAARPELDPSAHPSARPEGDLQDRGRDGDGPGVP